MWAHVHLLGRMFLAFTAQSSCQKPPCSPLIPSGTAAFIFPHIGLSSRVTIFSFFFNLSYFQRGLKEKDVLYRKHQASESAKTTRPGSPFLSYCLPMTFLALQTVCPQALSREMAPSPGHGVLWPQWAPYCPPAWAVDEETGALLHGAKVICIHTCQSGGL